MKIFQDFNFCVIKFIYYLDFLIRAGNSLVTGKFKKSANIDKGQFSGIIGIFCSVKLKILDRILIQLRICIFKPLIKFCIRYANNLETAQNRYSQIFKASNASLAKLFSIFQVFCVILSLRVIISTSQSVSYRMRIKLKKTPISVILLI